MCERDMFCFFFFFFVRLACTYVRVSITSVLVLACESTAHTHDARNADE